MTEQELIALVRCYHEWWEVGDPDHSQVCPVCCMTRAPGVAGGHGADCERAQFERDYPESNIGRGDSAKNIWIFEEGQG